MVAAVDAGSTSAFQYATSDYAFSDASGVYAWTATSSVSGLSYTLEARPVSGAGLRFLADPAQRLSEAGYVASDYTPSVPGTTPVVSMGVAGSECAAPPDGEVCTDRGTLRLTFEHPVRNPVLHVADIGEYDLSWGQSAIFRLTTPGVTLLRLSGGNLSVEDDTIQAEDPETGPACTSTTLVRTGCGSVMALGTVTSLEFEVDVLTWAIGNSFPEVPASYSPDEVLWTVSFDEDFGDAPGSYDAGDAARHVLSDLHLGSNMTADNPFTPNATATPYAPGGDSDDAMAGVVLAMRSSLAAVPWTSTVPVGGVSKAATACAWLDLDMSGTFEDDSAEESCTALAAGATSATFSWSVPPGPAGDTYLRLRIGYDAEQVSRPTGPADSGEVEDHIVRFVAVEPAIALEKSADPTVVSAAGEEVTFSFTVANTGNVELSGVVVTDDLEGLSDLACTPVLGSVLAPAGSPGDEMSCTATYTVTQDDVDRGELVNTAVARGTPPGLPDVTAEDDASVTVQRSPGLTLEKSAEPAAVAAAGEVVTYTFEVRNTGNVTLTDLQLTDELPGLAPVTCAPVAVGGTLLPGRSTTCTAALEVTQAHVDAGEPIENVAVVTATPPAGLEPPTATDAVTVAPPPHAPAVGLSKSADPRTVATAGEEVEFSFTVTNTGNVTLRDVTVTDPLAGLSDVDCGDGTNVIASLAPEAEAHCAATYVVTRDDIARGEVVNTATVEAVAPDGSTVRSEEASATVRAAQPEPAPAPALPATGRSGTVAILTTAALVLAAGALAVTATRRRRHDAGA